MMYYPSDNFIRIQLPSAWFHCTIFLARHRAESSLKFQLVAAQRARRSLIKLLFVYRTQRREMNWAFLICPSQKRLFPPALPTSFIFSTRASHIISASIETSDERLGGRSEEWKFEIIFSLFLCRIFHVAIPSEIWSTSPTFFNAWLAERREC